MRFPDATKLPKPPPAFLRALAAHQGRLRAYVVSLLLDPDVAEDVLQETNVVLCRRAEQFEPGTSFKAWAFRVAQYKVQEQRRRARRDRLVFDEDVVSLLEAESHEEDAAYEARRKLLLRCLRKLGHPQQRVVLEHYLDGRAVHEIAAERNRTANAISLVLYRARQSLMKCVATEEAPEPDGGMPTFEEEDGDG